MKHEDPCSRQMHIFSILLIFLLAASGSDAGFPRKCCHKSSYSPNTTSFLITNGKHHFIQQKNHNPAIPVSIDDLNKKYEEFVKTERMSLETLREGLYGAVASNNSRDTAYFLEMLYKNFPRLNHIDLAYEEGDSAKFRLIHIAAAFGFKDILDILASNGADLEPKDFMGNTALAVAVMKKQNDCIKVLVRHGARVNYRIRDYPSLIHYAAKEDQVDILEEIRLAGHSLIEDLGESWYTVWTPLELALVSEAYECAQYLILAGSPFREHQVELIYRGAVEKGSRDLAEFISGIFYYQY